MRGVVADNLKAHMERYFMDKPKVKNRNKYLAHEAELGLGTVQRTLACTSGASIDTLEALAKVFGIGPYEFLIPSQAMQSLMSAPAKPLPTAAPGVQEQLQRPPGRTAPGYQPVRHK